MALRQARWGLAFMAAWFAFGAFGFHRWEGQAPADALASALYLGSRQSFWDLYSFWGQCILFGVAFTVLVLQALERYNPLEASRMIAKEMKNHAVVVGYTHLGARVVEEFRKEGRPFVLIEKEASAVDHLIRTGEAVIVDNAKQASTLEDAGIERAALVVVASNNIETSLIVTKNARLKNKTARIIVRCYNDEFTDILESLGADEVISSSKSAFRELAPHLIK